MVSLISFGIATNTVLEVTVRDEIRFILTVCLLLRRHFRDYDLAKINLPNEDF